MTRPPTRVADRTELRYRDLFEFAPYAYVITDTVGVVIEANRAAARLFGIAHRRLPGKPLAVFVPLDERPRFRRQFVEITRALGPVEFELPIAPRAGTPRLTRVTAMGVRAETAAVRWMLVDVTEQRLAEEQIRGLAAELEQRVAERTTDLETERARLRAILEHVPAGIALRDADGRVMFANARVEELLGPIEGTTLDDGPAGRAFHPDGDEYTRDEWPITRALRGERVTAELLDLERPDGRRSWVEISCVPVHGRDGAVTSAIAILLDVTDRHLRDAAEREFVTNAAHELRTPLTAILSSIDVLQAGAKENGDDRDLFLEHIEREANRLARLTHALLVLARAQTHVERPRVDLVELEPLVRETAAAIEPAPGVEVEVRTDPTIAVLVDRDLAEQALTAIATNAAKYTHAGRIVFETAAMDGSAVVTVSDTGEGFDAATEARIFDRFYRGGIRDADGFGLGLAIARQSVDAMKGQLVLQSEPGRGTTARISLPAAKLVTP